ncbi:MAG TPA: ABC transporter permease subunit [Gemmatimonas sp.]|nr:ABC transporter permease subunit [Gemmatimonas sp.]
MRHRSSAGYVAVTLVSAPVVAGTLYSLAAAFGLVGAGSTGWDASRIMRVIGSSETWQSVLWTLYTAGVATIIAVIGAIALSVVLQRSGVGRALATFPLAVPYVAAGLAALLLLGQSGFFSRVAFAAGAVHDPAGFPELVYDRPGIALILAFAWKEFPFLALTAFAVLDTRGAELADTARTLGASAAATFRRVTLPLLWRGIAPATIAGFAYLVGQYELAVLLAPSAPQPLSVITYERASDPDLSRRGEAHVLGLLAMTLCGALVVVHGRSLRNADARGGASA